MLCEIGRLQTKFVYIDYVACRETLKKAIYGEQWLECNIAFMFMIWFSETYTHYATMLVVSEHRH